MRIGATLAFGRLGNKIRSMDKRDAGVLLNVAGAFAIKGAGLLVSLATVPAFMDYFSDNAVLGVWYTVVSVMGWILNFDLGVGNGLRNSLVVALADEDRAECRRLVSSAYFAVGGACAAFCAALAAVVSLVDWNSVLGISGDVVSGETLGFVTFVVLCGMAAQLFLKNVTAILYAMQMSAVNNLLNLCVSVLQLVFITFFPHMAAEQALKAMAVAYTVVSNIPALLATVVLFIGPLAFARPSPRFVTRESIKKVLSLGLLFFGAQLLYMLIANTNEVFISSLFGAEHVVEYQVYYKLYSLVGTLMALALTPVWSAVTLAMAQRQGGWLRRLFRRLALFGLLVAALELLLVLFTQTLFDLWLGGQSISASVPFCLAFAAFGALFSYQSVVASFANGLGQLSTQLKCYTVGVCVKVTVCLAASAFRLPWVFVIVGDALALVPFCFFQRRRCVRSLSTLSGE